jgi:hypothetical protein
VEGTGMNRRLLVSLMALGAVVTLIGAAGIFAVFTDRATTGNSSVTSGERASAADLQIASSGGPPIECGTFADDLVTDLITVTDVQPAEGGQGINAFICLRNAGSAHLTISAAAIDLVDVETDCTGDEAAAGDGSCGIAEPSTGVGELSSVLFAEIVQADCTTGAAIPGIGISILLSDLSGGAAIGGLSLLPGEFRCVRLGILYPTTTPDTAVQIAQTDKVTWRYAFDGTTSS